MSSNVVIGKTWVAFGEAGAVGSIHSVEDGYEVRMLGSGSAGTYPSLDVAKSALHAHLLPGSGWPEFREH
ncbi:methyltransferase [Salinibacterium sp. SYSU T00001]|uniref:methyltransferase n=1 Tax=Homoserinimonas sedimenticola TaxID=2986805 RepID=UPI0022369796|nr:methyltransferase [Salinibacterium sedimenticola]MCW4384734.1 methyltransferase [Salinibacterium sedimenticola]